MENKDLSGDAGNRFSDEDLQTMLGTVRHVSNKQDNDIRELYGLSGKGERESARKKDKTVIVIIVAGIVILVIAIGLVCSYFIGRALEHDPLKGVWSLDDVTIYSFNGKGHGTLSLPLNSYEFDYVLEDNVLKIDFTDADAIDRSYIFTVTEEELILTDSDENVFKFERTDEKTLSTLSSDLQEHK